MNRNREVLKHCPHFYSIINFEYYSDDLVTARLINIYKKYIFSANLSQNGEIEKIEKLDRVLNEYINNYTFRSEMKSDIVNIEIKKNDNVLETMVDAIITFFDNYEKLKFRKIQITRWL